MIKEEVKKLLSPMLKNWEVKNPKRIYFEIDKNDIKEISRALYKDFDMRLSTITGIDNENNFELIYHFSLDKTGEIFSIRIFIIDKNNPEIDSLIDLFKASDWVEREIHELLGIKFIGHPNLKHLLLDDDWPKNSYPLRKDFKNE
jgi:NADH-quinone oxidoreductase subunit C